MKRLIKELEEEKNTLQRKLKLTQKMLDEQIEKIKSHVSKMKWGGDGQMNEETDRQTP